jgi:hypothetical protein
MTIVINNVALAGGAVLSTRSVISVRAKRATATTSQRQARMAWALPLGAPAWQRAIADTEAAHGRAADMRLIGRGDDHRPVLACQRLAWAQYAPQARIRELSRQVYRESIEYAQTD